MLLLFVCIDNICFGQKSKFSFTLRFFGARFSNLPYKIVPYLSQIFVTETWNKHKK